MNCVTDGEKIFAKAIFNKSCLFIDDEERPKSQNVCLRFFCKLTFWDFSDVLRPSKVVVDADKIYSNLFHWFLQITTNSSRYVTDYENQ